MWLPVQSSNENCLCFPCLLLQSELKRRKPPTARVPVPSKKQRNEAAEALTELAHSINSNYNDDSDTMPFCSDVTSESATTATPADIFDLSEVS